MMSDIIYKNGFKYSIDKITGESTDISERSKLCDRFNKCNNQFGLLLSSKVTGVGLNLYGADRVIIVDPDWNPAIDNQAVDRVYRIG